MSLVIVGLNHVTTPVEFRERLAFPAEAIPEALIRIRQMLDGAGVVILSTCNRVEIYLSHTAEPAELCRTARAFLTAWHGISDDQLRPCLYEYEGRQAVGHLFRVAAGLDSLVLGEAQILGQVHDAYLAAQTVQSTDKVIHALFQKAFTVAKKVRTQSPIGVGSASVSSVAVDLAVSIFGDLPAKTVMVIGSGEMGKLTLRSLMSRGAGKVLVVNRDREKARAIAASYGGQVAAFDELDECLHRADIVISSTASPQCILRPDQFQRALNRRGQRPMLVIDIAVPRDVDARVGDLDNVYLFNVDDLEQVVNANLDARRRELESCLQIVERGVAQFVSWMQALAAEPTIVSMAGELHSIRQRELKKTLDALPELTEKQRQEVRYLSERIVNSILQRPMTEIKQEIGHHDPKTVLHLVKRLFRLEESR